MPRRGAITPKGERTSREILDAAIRCVARDGLASLTMQRVADEAGVAKRAVVYYYDTRQGLIEAIIRSVGDRMLDQFEEVVSSAEEPAEIVDRGFEALWSRITTDRALLAAWSGIYAESVTSPAIRESAGYIGRRLEGIVSDLIDAQLARGSELRVERDALLVLVVANVQGLANYFLVHGETAELRAAILTFQRFLTSVVIPADHEPTARRRVARAR